jgi:hypothetical protein
LVLLAVCGADLARAQPDARGPAFVDVTADSNIAYQVGYTLPYLIGRERAVAESTFGGAAAGDCDQDGDVDLFITYGNTGGPDGGGGPNRLYLNQLAEQGNGLRFEDHAWAAGVANTRPDGENNDRHSGPTFADMDGDGDLDLFLGGIFNDPSKIYENDGNCRFSDVTSNSPDIVNMLASHTISAGFGDYDLDGDLDLFLTHWATSDTIYSGLGNVRMRETDHLWRNESDSSGIRFVNVSEETGISDLTWLTRLHLFCGERVCDDGIGDVQIADFTFTGSFARINDDLWPDIAIAGDFGTSQLAISLGDGTFASLDSPLLRGAQYGMGSALGDIDNDGDLDWLVTSIFGSSNQYSTPRGNRFFINDGSPSLFVDDTERLGVADGSFAWGACLIDIDNDGDLDIYHTNGWSEPFLDFEEDYRSPSSRVFLKNRSGTYTENGKALGLAAGSSARGVVCADFDHDGDTDILELTDAPGNSARLWENRSAAAGRNSLRIKLRGPPPNTQAAGARIFATIGDATQMREIMIGSNYTSQNPPVQIFGLGTSETVDELFVEWPAIDSSEGLQQLGTSVPGPIAASEPGQTIVIRYSGL